MTVKTREGWGWKVAEGEGGGTAPPLSGICEIEVTRVATACNPTTAEAAEFAVWPMRMQPGDEVSTR